jgi:hypothetical protein
MSAYPKLTPETRYVLRRKSDGKFLEIWGWGIEWADKPSHGCPFFTSINLGPQRSDDFHLSLYRRFRSVKARVAGMTCELVPFSP